VPLLLGALSRVDGPEVQGLVRELLAGCQVQKDNRVYPLSGDDAINTAFDGNMAGLAQAVLFALEVNFGDFFVVPGASESDPPEELSSTSTPTSSRPGRRAALSSKVK
jgi:hypothetical protein